MPSWSLTLKKRPVLAMQKIKSLCCPLSWPRVPHVRRVSRVPARAPLHESTRVFLLSPSPSKGRIRTDRQTSVLCGCRGKKRQLTPSGSKGAPQPSEQQGTHFPVC